MRKQITGIFALFIIAMMSFSFSYAYYTDTETSAGNTFSAGTLDLQLSNDGITYFDGVIDTWDTPTNWAPGDTWTKTLHATNVGNVDILEMTILFETTNSDGDADGSQLDDVIIITSWREYFKNADDVWTPLAGEEYITHLQDWVFPDGHPTNPLTLAELDEMTNWASKTLDRAVTQDTESGDGILLRGGDHKDWKLEITFKFDETAGNEYQGDSCEMDITLTGTQNKVIYPNP